MRSGVPGQKEGGTSSEIQRSVSREAEIFAGVTGPEMDDLPSVFEPVTSLGLGSKEGNLPTVRISQGPGDIRLVPKKPWALVLYEDGGGVAVLHNPDNRLVSVKRLPGTLVPFCVNDGALGSTVAFQILDRTKYCPMCGRPWQTGDGISERMVPMEHWIDSDYFRMLQDVSVLGDGETPETPEEVQRQEPDIENSEEQEKDKFQYGTVGLDKMSFNQGYYDRFFIQLKKLGRGQRGCVYLCQHVLDRVPLGQFAVKAIPVGTSHKWLTIALREVALLGRLHHSNIIRYHHAWLEIRKPSTFVPEVPCLFVLMELANSGNLEEYIEVQLYEEERETEDLGNLPRDKKIKLEKERMIRKSS